jgi:transposase
VNGSGRESSWRKRWPDNLRTLFLPPYRPELNPQEPLWDELREKHFHNTAFNSLSALEDTLISGLFSLENNPHLVHSVSAWDWIINALKF